MSRQLPIRWAALTQCPALCPAHAGRGSPSDLDAPPLPPNAECKPAKRLPAKETGSIGPRTLGHLSGKKHPKGSARPSTIARPDLKLGVQSGQASAIPRDQLLAEIAGLEPQDDLDASSCPANALDQPGTGARRTAANRGQWTAFGGGGRRSGRPALAFTHRWANQPAGRARHVLPGNHRPGARSPNPSLEDRRGFR